ncbi:MAG: acyltransferase [SAR324 cluster bacterium]|uniref:Acyltransferase n=1 Tax=SAR324 cluster bacterium TaxID=2024889 RepID=A0A7X9FQI4_9DELT|nr:acyltransferase [SAR324 cluster bacterium]
MINYDDSLFLSRGKLIKRIRSIIFLLPAWFAPHKSLRVFFHRLRGVRIGKGVEIGYYCLIGNVHPYNIHIEDYAVITANCVLLDHDNALHYTFGGDVIYGKIRIGPSAFIGIASVIMPGVKIGEKAIVAPQSFVKYDVPAFTLVAGQPAKVIKSYEKEVK